MDATAYRFFLEKLLTDSSVTKADLPLRLTQLPIANDTDAFANLCAFLNWSCTVLQPDPATAATSPKPFLLTLFGEATRALSEVLTGTPADTHAFRTNALQLINFLSISTDDDSSMMIPKTESLLFAQACFLIEAFMHVGWCTNANEGLSKRAAHAFFLGTKKNMYHVSSMQATQIIGFLWGAWLCAQKTEGIRTAGRITGTTVCERFDFNIEDSRKSYLLLRRNNPAQLVCIPYSQKTMPHPVRSILAEGLFGTTFYIDNQPLISEKLLEAEEIHRKTMTGYRFRYQCKNSNGSSCEWTIAILWYLETIYRIDVIANSDASASHSIHADLVLECAGSKYEYVNGLHIAHEIENTVIRFIENPLGFVFSVINDKNAITFQSQKHMLAPNSKTATIIAWKSGKGAHSINETNLLGIFD